MALSVSIGCCLLSVCRALVVVFSQCEHWLLSSLNWCYGHEKYENCNIKLIIILCIFLEIPDDPASMFLVYYLWLSGLVQYVLFLSTVLLTTCMSSLRNSYRISTTSNLLKLRPKFRTIFFPLLDLVRTILFLRNTVWRTALQYCTTVLQTSWHTA